MDSKIKYHKNEPNQGESSQKEEVKPLTETTLRDHESFYALVYKTMFQSLFAYGMQICGDRDLVKDSIQELFSGLWKKRKTFAGIKSLKPYLFKSLKRKIRRELKKGKRMRVVSSFAFEASHEVRLIKDQQQIEDQYRLNQALSSLTDRQREAIYLKFYSNLSFEEVAQVLKISTKGAYKLISRALSALKKAMSSIF